MSDWKSAYLRRTIPHEKVPAHVLTGDRFEADGRVWIADCGAEDGVISRPVVEVEITGEREFPVWYAGMTGEVFEAVYQDFEQPRFVLAEDLFSEGHRCYIDPDDCKVVG